MSGIGYDISPAMELKGQIELLKYRLLNMVKRKYGGEPVSIVFTSYRPHEGVSTVTSNFALSLSAENGCNVLLVDCNQKKPSLHKIFKMNGDVVKQDQETLPDKPVLRGEHIAHVQNNLDLIVRENKAGEKERVVSIYEFNLFLQADKIKYDFIVIDCPALCSTSYSTLLAATVDATVLVVEAERVRRQALKRAIDKLEELGANICGVVLNKRRYPIPGMIYRML